MGLACPHRSMVLRGADGTARGAALSLLPAKYAPAVKTKQNRDEAEQKKYTHGTGS